MDKETMERQIRIGVDVKRAIGKETGLSSAAVSYALAFQRNGKESQRVRELALQRGGQVYCTLPECETIHDADGKMIQSFANGATITLDKATSEAKLEYRGVLVAVYHNVTIQMLSLIQGTAAKLK